MEKNTIKIVLFGIGLDTYCPQFEGLKERLEGYLLQVKKLEVIHPYIVNAGLVGTTDSAFEPANCLKRNMLKSPFYLLPLMHYRPLFCL